MQKDTLLQSPSIPSASNAAMGGARQASASGVPNKSENAHCTSPKAHRKLSMSKVIMRAMTEKGTRNRVSLAALKKAVSNNGYNMTHNIWRFKRVLKKLVDNGMLQQVTGKGTSGSFRLGKKRASKLKAKRRQQQQRRRRPGHRRSGQRRSRQRRSLLGSKQGHKRLFKGVRRVAKCRRH